MSPCHPFRPVPGQCGPNRRGPLPAPPFDPRDYWATRKCVSQLYASLGTKLDKADVVDPGAAAEAGKAADAKSTYEELSRILAKLVKKADKATTLEGYGITDAATKAELSVKADLVGGKVPAAQLPSYVDDVLEYDAMSAFPATGESGKIYVANDTSLVYRWSGTQYVEISPSPVLDDTVTETSSNGVKSSGVWSWVKSLLPHWLTSDYAEPATVASVANKADKATTLAGYGITDAVPFVEDVNGDKTAVTIGIRTGTVGVFSLANGLNVSASGYSSRVEGNGAEATGDFSCAEGISSTSSGLYSHAEGNGAVATGIASHAEGGGTIASGYGAHAEGHGTSAAANYSHAEGVMVKTREGDSYSFAWNGDNGREENYYSHGTGTFNINPVGGLDGIYIGEQTLLSIMSDKANKATPSAAGNLAALTADGDIEDSGKTVGDFLPRVSNEPVRSTFDISGPLFLDMDGYIQLNTAGFIYGSFNNIREAGDSPISLRTELDSKVGSFASVGGASATVENGVAELSDFFTKSNGLLTATIDDRLPIPISAKSAGFTTESYKRFIVTVSGDMTVTLHTPTSGDAEIFECRFNGSSLSADASITFAGATATTMDTDCGTVKAGKVSLMSAFWNGTTWDVNWKVEG